MNHAIESFAHCKAFVITVSGLFEVAEFPRVLDDLLAHPDWQVGCHCLFDYRAIDFSRLNQTAMRWAADQHAERDARIGNGRGALVVKNLADFGLGRMYEMAIEDRVSAQLRVFCDMAEARRYIGIDPA